MQGSSDACTCFQASSRRLSFHLGLQLRLGEPVPQEAGGCELAAAARGGPGGVAPLGLARLQHQARVWHMTVNADK